MTRRSTAVFVAVPIVFVTALAWQRQRSSVLAAHRDRAAAQRLATETGLDAVDVMALRVMLADLPLDELRDRARKLLAARSNYGPKLAILVTVGRRDFVESLLAEAGGDRELAVERLRELPEAVVPRRFAALIERFETIR